MLFSFMGRTVQTGSPIVSLTPPDMLTIKHIMVNGNCLFRLLTYTITGSWNQHMSICTAILDHMIDIVCHRYTHASGLSYQSLHNVG